MKIRIACLAVFAACFAFSMLEVAVVASEGSVQWTAKPRPGRIETFYNEGVDPETRLYFQELAVEIRDSVPNTSMSIYVRGRHLGDVVTNEEGEATFELERENVVPGSDGRPRRRINTGDLCEVVTGFYRVADRFEQVIPVP